MASRLAEVLFEFSVSDLGPRLGVNSPAAQPVTAHAALDLCSLREEDHAGFYLTKAIKFESAHGCTFLTSAKT